MVAALLEHAQYIYIYNMYYIYIYTIIYCIYYIFMDRLLDMVGSLLLFFFVNFV